MKTLTLLMVAMVAVVFAPSSVMAVPVDCDGLTTLQQHIDANAGGGCFHDTKIYNNWSYSGGGAVTATLVDVNHQVSHSPGSDVHSTNFVPAGTLWTTNFTIFYSIEIAPGNPGHSLVDSTLQLFTDSAPGTGQTGTATKTEGTAPGGALLDVLTCTTVANPGCQDAGVWAPGVQAVYNVLALTGLNTSSFLNSVEESFSQEVPREVIPEPGTLLLLGSGAAAFGLMRRRRQSGPKS